MISFFIRFRAPKRPVRWVAAAAGLLVVAGGVRAQEDNYKPGSAKPAQKDKPSQKDTRQEEGKSLFGGDKAKSQAGGPGAWSIIIEAFRGDDQEAAARAGIDKVRMQGGLADAYLDHRGEATVIAFGRYPDPASKEARADLDRVRGVEIPMNGTPQKVFLSAFLAPPADIHGTRPEYDLRNAKKLNGDWVLYTLQVGVYSREDRKPASPADMAEFRKMAEQAVLKLRSEGEQAFYYHGPSRSVVTIGLWGTDDYDEAAPTGFKDKSPALHAMRQRFPNNLQNGMGIKERQRLTDPKTGAQVVKEQLQSSGMVVVPKE
jgi:hypothetical protein